MDQKSWLWKKRSTEKTLVAADKANNSLIRNEELTEVQQLLTEKAELERDLRILNENLSVALSDCNAKDIITKKQVKIAQEAIAGWEKADAEAISLKKELDKALQQKAASEEKLSYLDAGLKECMKELRFVRDEQEKRVHDAVMKTSEEYEKIRIALDEKLVETSKKFAKLDAENTQLIKALSGKDKVIEDLSKYRSKVEADLNALVLRIPTIKKENVSLNYEVRVLEKELEIRNEETEFNRRTADVSQKQQQESVQKIAKLESECQKLRLLVQKRLPGSDALTKMKNEVQILGKDQIRRRSNPSLISSMDFGVDLAPDTPNKKINFLSEQLHILEEENRSLKDALNKKSSELQFSRNMYSPKASRLSRTEEQVEESLKGQTSKFPGLLRENSLAASSDMGSFTESWASALISELEQLKSEKQLVTPSMRTSEMNLMDDFAEMEKLAVVSVDYPPGSSHQSSEEETAPVCDFQSKPLISSKEIKSGPNLVSKSLVDASDSGKNNNISTAIKKSPKFQSNVSVSVHKILGLLEGINVGPQENGVAESHKNSETQIGYMARVFQWKSDELYAILQEFVQTCNNLLNGTIDLEKFVEQVASNLDWIMNHCFSLQDVSSMKDAIRNQLDWDDTRSESEVESGTMNIQREVMNSSCETEVRQLNLKEEGKSKETSYVDLEGGLEKGIVKGESFRHQLQEIKDMIESLQSEMEIMKHCERNSGDQIEIQNTPQLDYSSRRVEETCNDLKIQLKSITSKEVQDHENHWEKQLQNDREITAASEKLAECQETILNLGKQLKELATPKDAALSNKAIIPKPEEETVVTSMSTPQRNIIQRMSLLDKMVAEDGNVNSFSAVNTYPTMESRGNFTTPNDNNYDEDKITVAASMAISPYKKRGGRSFFKKLFSRVTKGNKKKISFS